MVDITFFKGKKVFITGHTGFKGTWLTKILLDAGAIVKGYSLEAEEKSLFQKISLSEKIESIYGDIRDFEFLQKEFDEFSPEIVFHLAAQPIVRESYKNPHYTYETNVMGTVNILECVRKSESVKSFVNVTTDKVYENLEDIDIVKNQIQNNGNHEKGFKEDDKLNGRDPYSNSKSCSELITSSYKQSFLEEREIGISTVRAGNVIGGGDSAKDRIIPDCIRAAKQKENIIVRNPYAVRPYQHVLDALFAYLLIAQKQYEDRYYAGNYNVGPDEKDIIKNKELVDIFCNKWGENVSWIDKSDNGPYESKFLKLDCTKLKTVFDWKPVWNIEKAVEKVVEFEKWNKEELENCMDKQIKEFMDVI